MSPIFSRPSWARCSPAFMLFTSCVGHGRNDRENATVSGAAWLHFNLLRNGNSSATLFALSGYFPCFFAYGITIAGFILDRVESEDMMTYRHWFSYREAHLSLMLLLSLWPWYQKQSTYPRLTTMGLGIIYIVLAATKYGDPDSGVWAFDENSTFEYSCAYVKDATLRFSNSIFHAQFSLLIWIGRPILRSFERWSSAKTIRNGFRSLRRCIPVLAASLAFAFMWIDLVILVRSRTELNSLAGPSYEENKWTFGQIAAVTTLLPLLADFYRIWLCE